MGSNYNNSDYIIQALVDGELGGDEQQKVMDFIKSSPSARARYEQLQAQRDLICEWWHRFYNRLD